ncbi:MAG: cupredoxin domain-containing protein [Actinomycetota bacterium]
MKRRSRVALVFTFAAATLVACGGNQSESTAPEDGAQESPGAQASPETVEIAALDYSFEAPETITGGLVEFSFTNRGQEPHFFGLAAIPEGNTFDEVKGALTAAPPAEGPPTGPPPFEDFGGIAAGDPGVSGTASMNLPAGSYVFYCLIPSPDGVSHANKGMIKQMEVTEGPEGDLPEADTEHTFVATDFAFDKNFSAEPGDNVFRIRNEGRQLHEINLVEMAADKTMDDLIEWHRQPQGPPPARFLAGVAIKPGEEATTTLEVADGQSYAFICAIPDVLGDFAPHIVKGMHTEVATVS